jgi:hypothetical protein
MRILKENVPEEIVKLAEIKEKLVVKFALESDGDNNTGGDDD